MAKTSDATLKAIKKYNQKSKFINIKYTPNAIFEYNRICQYCKDNSLSIQGYIKDLIKRDLDSKGFMFDGTGENVSENESDNNSNRDSDIVEDNTETD